MGCAGTGSLRVSWGWAVSYGCGRGLRTAERLIPYWVQGNILEINENSVPSFSHAQAFSLCLSQCCRL